MAFVPPFLNIIQRPLSPFSFYNESQETSLESTNLLDKGIPALEISKTTTVPRAFTAATDGGLIY